MLPILAHSLASLGLQMADLSLQVVKMTSSPSFRPGSNESSPDVKATRLLSLLSPLMICDAMVVPTALAV